MEKLEKMQIELDNALKKITILEAFAKCCRDDFDCDRDAHRYNTTCRCCEAEKAIDQIGLIL